MNWNELTPPAGEIWHPWSSWEEIGSNMWGVVSHRKTWLEMAVAFTGNAELYGEWMRQVVAEWPMSCAHNLTKPGDKRAWIGHAAVAKAIRCPEDIVREAWGRLTQQQQDEANAQAAAAIELWRREHAKA